MMKNKFSVLAIFALLATTSCQDKGKMNTIEDAKETASTSAEETTSVATNEAGENLAMTFNLSKGTAKVVWKQDTIVLKEEKTASGFSYKNEQYELKGKGENVDFSKDGKLVFKN